MKGWIHAVFGMVALLLIGSFWLSTLVSELFFSQGAVVSVKQAILYSMVILIPAMALTGGSGALLARGRSGSLLTRKQKRMRIIMFNGLLIMLPSAFFLYRKAVAGELDQIFYLIQAVELIVGPVQIFLMGSNVRDGLKLSGRLSSMRRKYNR